MGRTHAARVGLRPPDHFDSMAFDVVSCPPTRLQPLGRMRRIQLVCEFTPLYNALTQNWNLAHSPEVRRSPDRPNPLGLHRVTVRRVIKNRLRIGPIEAIDGTPVIDIKPVLSGLQDF